MKKLITAIAKNTWTKSDSGASILMRTIGNQPFVYLDPFILFDHFNVKLPEGFTDHGHRGFQKLTYVLSGELLAEDFNGKKTHLKPGDAQWITMGKGMVHCQMPTSFKEPTTGFHVWVNLHSKNKMIQPMYHEVKSKEIPVVKDKNVEVKVIAGEWGGKKGAIQAMSPVNVLDVTINNPNKQVEFEFKIPQDWNRLMFVHDGKMNYNDQGNELRFQVNDSIMFHNQTQNHMVKSQRARFFLVYGKPLNEEMEQLEGFVMNLEEEVHQAVKDYREGKNGFEKAKGWKSTIRELADDPQKAKSKK